MWFISVLKESSNMEMSQSFNKSFLHIYPNQKTKLHGQDFLPNKTKTVFYHVVSKSKDRYGERVYVDIDRNLSIGLRATIFKDESSLTISATRIETDVAAGRWVITVDLDYVVGFQEHISQVSWFYMPTVQGSWDKRLKAVEEAFMGWTEQQATLFQQQGFQSNNIYHIRNLVAFMNAENQKSNFLSSYSNKTDMNTIMLVYDLLGSKLNLDFTSKVDLFCYPTHHREYQWFNTVIPTFASLNSEEQQLIEMSIDFFKSNKSKINQITQDCIEQNRKLDLSKFKEQIQKILN